MPVAAIASRTLDIDTAHIVERQSEHLGELLLQIMRCLRGGPRGEPAILELSNRAGWANRTVGVNGKVVGRADFFGTFLAHRTGSVACTTSDFLLRDCCSAD